jgi:hypothetical protein
MSEKTKLLAKFVGSKAGLVTNEGYRIDVEQDNKCRITVELTVEGGLYPIKTTYNKLKEFLTDWTNIRPV